MMKKTEKLGAFAAMVAAVVCAFSAHAVDWSEYKNGTYNVPADVTNEVTQSDFSAFNNISKVVFGNENSAILVATSNFPASVYFQGPGTVIMQEKAIFTGGRDSSIRRTLGTGDENGFVKFVFKEGMDSHNGGTASLYYFHDKNLGGYVATNATLFLDGSVTNVSFCGGGRRSLNGRIDLGENIDLVLGQNIGGNDSNTSNFFGVVRQRGGRFLNLGSYLGYKGSATSAYILENGSLTVNSRWYSYSHYIHFRQNGGCFNLSCWHRPESENGEYTLPADFIYGGSAVATNAFESSTPMFLGPMNISVMGDAKVNAGWLRSYSSQGGTHVHNVCVNGGELTMDTRIGSTNVYYSFNGGTLRNHNSGPTMFGNNGQYDNPSWVLIYENGGCIYNDNINESNNQYLKLPHLKEPVGNVVWNVEMSDELRGKVWQSPPSVVITDSTGAGSNAVAIADYDFDSGKVTNITVVCRGENYSDALKAVTANLRYKNGEALLSTPLACGVGPCIGGDVTLAGGKTIYAGGITNTYHGATIVDMDRDGEYDHPAVSGLVPEYHSLMLLSRDEPRPSFLNTTNIIVRSGDLSCQHGGASFDVSFPSCRRLEFYGGHFANWNVTKEDVVIGGETWLVNHNLGYGSTVVIPDTGTLIVDVACMTNGITPKLKYGEFVLRDGATVVVKNLKTMPRGSNRVVLDLSEVETFTTARANINLIQPDDGAIEWDADAKKLYAIRDADGFFIIYR